MSAPPTPASVAPVLAAIERFALLPLLPERAAALLAGPVALAAAGALLDAGTATSVARTLAQNASILAPVLAQSAPGVELPTMPDPVPARPTASTQTAPPVMRVGADGRIKIENTPFALRDVCASLPGSRPVRRGGRHAWWTIPSSPAAAAAAIEALTPFGVVYSNGVRGLAEEATAGASARARFVDGGEVPEGDGTDVVNMPLWSHQRVAVGYAEEATALLLAIPMSGGKTSTAIAALNRRQAARVLIVCPNKVRGVWPREVRERSQIGWHIEDGTRPLRRGKGRKDLSTSERLERAERVLFDCDCPAPTHAFVVNYEVLATPHWRGWVPPHRLDAIIYDECLPEGTMIDTPAGPRAIEDLRVGDEVIGIDHVTGEPTVTGVKYSFVSETSSVLHEVDGVSMTGNHPVWTARGYVRADQVCADDTVCRVEVRDDAHDRRHVRMVRLDDPEAVEAERIASEVLRPHVFGEVADVATGLRRIHACEAGSEPGSARAGRRAHALTAAAPRRDGEAGGTSTRRGQSVQGPTGAGPRTGERQGDRFRAPRWGQWPRTDRAAGAALGSAGLADRGRRAHRTFVAVAEVLLPGRGLAGAAGGDRVRRAFAPDAAGARPRRPQGRISERAGMGGVAVHQPSGTGADRPSASRRRVYNIETGTGNYVAAGLLVHNCHKLKSPTGAVSKAAARLVNFSGFRLGLSGTPVPQNWWDIFGVFRALDPGIFGEVWTPFRNQWAIMRQTAGGQQFPDPRHSTDDEELSRRFHSITYRPVVDLKLPAVTDSRREIELEPAARLVYDELANNLWADLTDFLTRRDEQRPVPLDRLDDSAAGGSDQICGDHQGRPVGAPAVDPEYAADVGDAPLEVTASNILTRMLRLQQITGGSLTTDAVKDEEGRIIAPGVVTRVSTAKADMLAEVLDEIGCTGAAAKRGVAEPVVVFCRFRSDLDAVRALAEKEGLRYGEVSGRRGDGLDVDSRMASDIDVCGVQIQAGGTGVDLTRARFGVWYSLGYSVADYDQARSRLVRTNQSRPVAFIHLVALDTADQAVYDAIDDRRACLSAVLRQGGIDPRRLGIEEPTPERRLDSPHSITVPVHSRLPWEH